MRLLPFLLLNACQGPAPDDLDAEIRDILADASVPAVQVAVFTPDEVLFAGAYGMADIDEGRANTTDTPFLLASVSKAFTAATLLQLWEDGAFGLDDDVADHLDFPVENPSYPDTPITFRQLLSHTGSIGDPPDEEFLYNWEGDYPLSLHDYVRSLFDPDGERYDPDTFYLPVEPGTTYAYSNIGYALAGLLAEVIAGRDFAELSEANLTDPLAMFAGWKPSEFPASGAGAPAMPYTFDEAGQPVALGHYGIPDYTNGTLCTDVVSLTHFLMALQGGGAWNGVSVLEPDTVALMQTPVVDIGTSEGPPTDYGLGLFLTHAPDGEIVWHSGGDYGVSTVWEFYPEEGVGIAMLNNGHRVEDVFALGLVREAAVAWGERATAP